MSYFNAIRFLDPSGVPQPVFVENGAVLMQEYLYGVAEGEIPKHKGWTKTGYNNSIGTTEEDMWTPGTPYVFPPSGVRMYVKSTSNLDYSGTTPGAGVNRVRVRYLDSNYIEQENIIALSGLNEVTTSGTDIFRINSFRAVECGSSGVAKGNITIGSGTNYWSYLGSGFTRARNIIYTVPSGNTLYVTSIAFSAVSAATPSGKTGAVRFTTKATVDDVGSRLTFFMPYNEVILQDSPYEKPLLCPTKLPEKTDIKVTVIATEAGCQGTCALRGWLEWE